MHVRKLLPALAAALVLVTAPAAQADINVGVTLSATGPAASLGIPEKNTFELLPDHASAAQKINWIILDDGSDTTKAVTNTRSSFPRTRSTSSSARRSRRIRWRWSTSSPTPRRR